MQLKINLRKPRNPFVAPSLMRRSGTHRTTQGGQRQAAQHALRRELDRMRTHSP
jgi:hypothetical protein